MWKRWLPLTEMWEGANWSPTRCGSVGSLSLALNEVEQGGAKMLKKPMTNQREKWSSAFFHRYPPRCFSGTRSSATAPVPMDKSACPKNRKL
jgi:hypothetical protein